MSEIFKNEPSLGYGIITMTGNGDTQNEKTGLYIFFRMISKFGRDSIHKHTHTQTIYNVRVQKIPNDQKIPNGQKMPSGQKQMIGKNSEWSKNSEWAKIYDWSKIPNGQKSQMAKKLRMVKKSRVVKKIPSG